MQAGPTEDGLQGTLRGGFRLIPENIEIWQGRKNRLRERSCSPRTS